MDKQINLLIFAFVTLIIGVVLLSSLSTSVWTASTTATKTETVDISAARLAGNVINETYYFHLSNGCPNTGWRADAGTQCELVNGGVKNSSGGVLTDPSDYVFISNGGVCSGYQSGDIRFRNSELMNTTQSNTTSVTYTYCPDGYMPASWNRVIINLVPGFFALALLLISVYFFYLFYKEVK